MSESSLAWKVAWATNRKRREQQQKRIAELEAEVERLESQVAFVARLMRRAMYSQTVEREAVQYWAERLEALAPPND